MKKIIILGASGSIGLQAIDICLDHQDKYNIVAISIGERIDILRDILAKIDIKFVCVKNYNKQLVDDYPTIKFYFNDIGLLELLDDCKCNIVINALVGFTGLKPTIRSIENGYNIALANKETLVVAGAFIKEYLNKYQVDLLPIDSEHSAIFQCLQGNKSKDINKLIITASGGSFLNKTKEELKDVSVESALKHPNWSMGAKITIDSATMINKGFEVIEAYWLFDIDYDHIEVIIHPESIIHSMIEYKDNSIIAQMGVSSMKIPIQYALSYPDRDLCNVDRLDFNKLKSLSFRPIDYDRFPLLALAYKAGKLKGNAPCILNAANEVCNKAFLDNKISFLDIEKYIFDAFDNIEYIKDISLEDIYKYDKITRQYVNERIKRR